MYTKIGYIRCGDKLFLVFSGAMCLTFDISSSCQAIACGDSSGYIHIFSNVSSGPVINTYSRPTELPDTPTSYTSFSINDYNTPLSVIPMPIVPMEMPLASHWPQHLVEKVYRLVFSYSEVFEYHCVYRILFNFLYLPISFNRFL